MQRIRVFSLSRSVQLRSAALLCTDDCAHREEELSSRSFSFVIPCDSLSLSLSLSPPRLPSHVSFFKLYPALLVSRLDLEKEKLDSVLL